MNDRPDPAAGWRHRVAEQKEIIAFVDEEKRQLLNEQAQLEKAILKAKEAVRQEKLKLAVRLEETEREGDELEAQCAKQSSAKLDVERIYQQALDEYDRLHDVVKLVKTKEKECDGRQDYDRLLQQESYEWAEEEHRLRMKLSALQTQIKATKQKHQDEVTAAEAKLHDAETRLHSDRMSREVNGKSSSSYPNGSRAPSIALRPRSASRNGSVSLGRGAFTDDSMILQTDMPQVNTASVALPPPILVNKASSRKRDCFGDVTNQ